MGDEGVADVLDGLGDRVEEDDFRGEFGSVRDHRNRVDDRDGVKESLDENFPNRGDVAVFYINRAEEEGDAERENIKFENRRNREEPT